MEGLKAIEFVEDIMNAQNNYIAIRESGFFHKSKEIRILLRKMETDGIHNT